VPLSARLPTASDRRHAISLVEPAFNGHTNPAASTSTGASHHEAGRADPRSMEETRAERGDRTDERLCRMRASGRASSPRPDRPCRSQIEDHKDVPVRGRRGAG